MPPQVVPAARRAARRVRDFAIDAAGGRPRMRVVLTLAAVLGLSGADAGTVSATAGNLERAFGIGNTQIGVLLSVVGLVGALFTIPAGILADRTRRTRLLGGSIVVWAAAVVVSGPRPPTYGGGTRPPRWPPSTRRVTASTGPTLTRAPGQMPNREET